jgi:hypothetical protein
VNFVTQTNTGGTANNATVSQSGAGNLVESVEQNGQNNIGSITMSGNGNGVPGLGSGPAI